MQSWPVQPFVELLLRIARIRPTHSGPWDLAYYPSSGTICLVVDGWLSQGNDDHLGRTYMRELRVLEPLRVPTIRAFTYAGPGLAYTFEDTLRSAGTHTNRLTEILSACPPQARFILTAFSLGGAIALLALNRLLNEQGSTWLRQRVPLTILLQPALYGSPEILDFLQRGPSPFTPSIPPIALDLGPREGQYPTEARGAIPRLLNAGLAVDIVYANGDAVAGYTPIDDRRLWQYEISIEELNEGLTRVRQPDKYLPHLRLPRAPQTVIHIYHRIKPLNFMGRAALVPRLSNIRNLPQPPLNGG